MNCVLGIDGGANKTVCTIINEQGQILGRGEAGASNYQVIGAKAAFSSLNSAISLAVNSAQQAQVAESINFLQVKAICLGLAGVGRSKDMRVVRDLVEQLQSCQDIPVTWDLSTANVVICHDAAIALVGGLGYDVGIVVNAGTGSIVFGKNNRGETKRVGGWGHLLGDCGSAYQIAIAGLRAAMGAYDGVTPPTLLIERFSEHLKLLNWQDLIPLIYQQEWSVKEIAALAPIVTQTAATGDKAATNIIEQAVEELVQSTLVVVDALFSKTEALEVVTAGSVWQGLPLMQEKFKASLLEQVPTVQVIFPRHEASFGAGLLALKTLSK